MDLGLRHKVVFITGGSKGIGRACALEFAREGARVAICARREDELRQAAEAIRQATGADVFPVVGDMMRWEDVQRCVDAAAAHFGGLDILVNCAGASPGGLILNLAEEDWTLSLQLKFMGYVRCAKAAIPYLLRRGSGRIVNVVGNDGIKPAYWELTASAANAADLAMTYALAEPYGPQGVVVNAVNPGPVAADAANSSHDRPADPAQGGSSFPAGRGTLRARPDVAGPAASRLRAFPLRPRDRPRDRRDARAASAGGCRRAGGRGSSSQSDRTRVCWR